MPTIPFAKWRLITSSPARGSWNMAVDEAILEGMYSSNDPPTLRLYAWEPACLSLGYAQPSSDVDLVELMAHKWDLVRRPTGGKAILHTDELTYSVIGPTTEPRLRGGVLESYQCLSKALLQALHNLGAPAQAVEINNAKNNQATDNPICFEVPSNYEITVDKKKLLGNAQARRRNGVLQHGSLPLFGDITNITKVLHFEKFDQQTQAAQRLAERATTLEAILGVQVTWQRVAEEFISAFEQTLNIELEHGELSRSERERATELEKEKYINPEWIHRI
jgi:lipoate-protein ligase A